MTELPSNNSGDPFPDVMTTRADVEHGTYTAERAEALRRGEVSVDRAHAERESFLRRERQRRISDWERRLHKITVEMQEHLGDPGHSSYPPEMDMAVNLAWRALYREVNHA